MLKFQSSVRSTATENSNGLNGSPERNWRTFLIKSSVALSIFLSATFPAAVSQVEQTEIPSTPASVSPPATSDGAAPPAQTSDQPSTDTSAATTDKPAKPSFPLFLWKGTREGQTVYLLGTIHVAKPSFYPLPKEIENALKESSTLFVEADITKLEPAKVLESLKQQGAYRPPETLSKSISPQTKAILNDYLSWAGEPISIYDGWKPWVVAQILSSGALRRAGFKGELGIDAHLLKEAHATGKKIVPLESIESQLKLIEGFDKPTQEKMLAADCISLKNMGDELTKISNAWYKGDLDSLSKVIDETLGAQPEFKEAKDKLLDARNLSMAESLEKLMPASGTCLVAVGSAHLAGKSGLLEIFKANGFDVKQVCTDKLTQRTEATAFGGNNLHKLYYPEGHFRVMLPGDPEMKYSSLNGVRAVDYTYPEFAGSFQVSYVILPVDLPSDAARQKLLEIAAAEVVKKTNAKLISNVPFRSVYGPGIQMDCKLPIKAKTTNEAILCRIRLQVYGRILYIIGGQGTSAWIGSKRLAQVMNSLEIVTAQSTPTRSTASTTSKPSGSYASSSSSYGSSYSSSRPSFSSYRSSSSHGGSFGSNYSKSSDILRKTTDSWEANHRGRMYDVERRVRQGFERSHQHY